MRRITNHAPSRELERPRGRTRIDTTADSHAYRCRTCGQETETDMRSEWIRVLRAHTLGVGSRTGPHAPAPEGRSDVMGS